MQNKKTTEPLVSIIMPTYNDSKYINLAIKSVQNQTYQNWEFLIVDDCSTDQTNKIIQDFEKIDSRIKFSRNKKNLGLVRNLNCLIKKAKGKYIARIDGDDEWLSNKKLSEQIDFLERKRDYVLCGTKAIVVDPNGKELFRLDQATTDSQVRNVILKYNCFRHGSVVFRKDAVESIGNYDESLEMCEDHDLWLRLGMVGKMANIPKYRFKYLINPNGLSETRYKLHIDIMIKVINKYKNYYPGYSHFMVFIYRIRRYYPVWFRGEFTMNIKQKISNLFI